MKSEERTAVASPPASPTLPGETGSIALILAVTGFGAFTLSDALLRDLVAREGASQVLLITSLLVCLFIIPSKPLLGCEWFGTSRATIMSAARGLLSAAMYWLSLYAIALIPLGDVYGIRYLSPVIVAVAGWLLLAELPGRGFLPALILGVLGVGLIVPLEGGGDLTGYLAALAAAASSAASLLLVRGGRKGSTPFAEVFVPMLVGVVLMLALTDAALQLPSGSDFLTYLAAAACLTLGRVLLVLSLHGAPANVASLASYSQLGWGILIGWFLLGDVPTAAALAGACCVTVGSVLARRAGR